MRFRPNARDPLFVAIQTIAISHRPKPEKTRRDSCVFSGRAASNGVGGATQRGAVRIGITHGPVVARIPQPVAQRM